MRLFLIFIFCMGFHLHSIRAVLADTADKNYTLIFTTFDDTSAKEHAYLRDSIQTMLMSRLSAHENIEVIDKVLSKKELAVLAGKYSEEDQAPGEPADYLVSGGVYALADGINVQVTMYPFDSSRNVLNFSKISEKSSDIIAANEELIATIIQELVGDTVTRGAVGDTVDGSVSGFTTAHPEAAYKKGLYSGTIVESELHGIDVKASGVKKTVSIAGEIIASTVGDLDGDGVDELVSLSSSTLNIYQIQERSIVEVAEMKLPPIFRGHGLTVADLNEDGKLEIYISGTEELRVASKILSWSEVQGFDVLARDVRYYLRPIYSKASGWRLAGQRRGSTKTDFVGKGIYLLDLDEAFNVSEKSRLPIPEGINLFDFSYAELDGKKGEELVVLDRNEKLRVINSDNELLWVSNSTFGGSKTYIGPSLGAAVDEQSRTSLSVEEEAGRELIFVPARILVTDVDGDGVSEIVVNENKSGMLGFFYKLRSYDGGTVVGLAWNGSELTEAWRTGRYKGYVVDYFLQIEEVPEELQTVADSKHTARGKFYVINMPHSGSIVGLLPGVNDTRITVYDLDFYKQKQVDNN